MSLTSALRWFKRFGQGLARLGEVPRLTEQAAYLQREVARLQAENRRLRWHSPVPEPADATQTKASFDFQWSHLPSGKALPSDEGFMTRVAQDLVSMTGRPREWFAGRSVVDIGCGLGRYTDGFLQLGANVTACDQSPAALARTAELCERFGDRLRLKQVDLLAWDEAADFDLAFSYGVVHHTGNTYRAIEHVGRKLCAGGRLFLMVYNMPEDFPGYHDVNAYEAIAAQNEALTFEERRRDMIQRFGEERAHGWFDATSPRINDRLTFGEIRDLLTDLGFVNVAGRIVARDHYITADRGHRPDVAPA